MLRIAKTYCYSSW